MVSSSPSPLVGFLLTSRTKVLIDGFELDATGVQDWQTRLQGLVNTTSKRPVGPTSGIPWKEPREDRQGKEHALIPRLKVS